MVAERVKRSHREIDADRRLKEAAIVRRLEELTEGEAQQKRRKSGRGSRRDLKRDKVSVLTACAEKIARLEAMVADLSQGGPPAEPKQRPPPKRPAPVLSVGEQRVRALAQHLQALSDFGAERRAGDGSEVVLSSKGVRGLPPQLKEAMSYLDSHHALYSVAVPAIGAVAVSHRRPHRMRAGRQRVRPAAHLTPHLLHTAPNAATDSSSLLCVRSVSGFLEMTGWSRSDIVNRMLSPPRHLLLEHNPMLVMQQMTEAEKQTRPLVRQRSIAEWRERPRLSLNGPSVELEGEDGRLWKDPEDNPRPFVHCPIIAQYPSSLRKARELAEGKTRSMRAPWRCVWADGFLYEVHCTVCVVKAEEQVEADGRRWMKPLTAVLVGVRDDGIPVDPL